MNGSKFNIVLGELLTKARLDRGLSQLEVSKRLNVSRSRVSSWECGVRNIFAEDLYMLCSIYNINVNDLYEQTRKYLGK